MSKDRYDVGYVDGESSMWADVKCALTERTDMPDDAVRDLDTLVAYINAVTEERDEWHGVAKNLRACHDVAFARAEKAEAEVERLIAERDEVRSILASTDIVSLPHDYPLAQMARDRMDRIKDLTLDGLAQIGRWEKAEAEVERLRELLSDLMSWFPDKPSRPEWRITAGEYGADAAVAAARAALATEDKP